MIEMTGIPGTISSEVRKLRWWRLPENSGVPGRAYRADLADGFLIALVSQDAAGKDGKLLWHISVSHRDKDNQPDRVPSWDELKHAAYRLVQADVPLILIFPRRSTPPERYVNFHPTTLHLWEAEQDVDQ